MQCLLTALDSDSVFGRKAGPGMGGRLCSGGSLAVHRVPPVSLCEGDLLSAALPQSFLGVWYVSACLLNKDQDDRSGHDLNFVTGALCPRTVTLVLGVLPCKLALNCATA